MMDDEIKVSIVDPEPIVLTVGEGKSVTQELYAKDGKIGITYGNLLDDKPWEDVTDLVALYKLAKGED